MLQDIISIHNQVTSQKLPKFKRYLYNKVNWSKRLLGIIGARGTGKTIMVLQYYREKYDDPDKCLYISADNPLVLKDGVYATGSEFFTYGGECLIIDEVHKCLHCFQ